MTPILLRQTGLKNRLNEVKAEVELLLSQFKLSEALKRIYSLIWDDFCSWYLEWIKPHFEQPIALRSYDKTVYFFEQLMVLLHPFMPFVTEEIYHLLKQQENDLCIKQQDIFPALNESISIRGKLLQNAITAIRDCRMKNQLKPKDPVKLYIQTSSPDDYRAIEFILSRQVNTEGIGYVDEMPTRTIIIPEGKDKFYIEANQAVDPAGQKEELLKEINYLNGFLASVNKKLGNERFVQNAKPEVIELEKKKQADAEAKIISLKESLESIGT